MMQKIKQAFGVQDMTVGRPMDSLVRFSIPLLLGNLAQQLYNTVDSIIVGKYVGDTALAAVGTAGPILNLLIVLFMGIATGASILSAQYFGAKDREQLSRAVGSTIFLTIASGLVMTVVGYFVSPWLVAMVTPPPEVAPGATEYLQIIFIGILGCGMYNILSGVLRGLGDSLNPLIYLVIASLMNIVLDLYFVRDLGMGVAGVAWATIMAQAVSGVLLGCLLVVMTIFANSRKFIKSRVQDFFLNRMEKEKFFSVETGREMRHAVRPGFCQRDLLQFPGLHRRVDFLCGQRCDQQDCRAVFPHHVFRGVRV